MLKSIYVIEQKQPTEVSQQHWIAMTSTIEFALSQILDILSIAHI